MKDSGRISAAIKALRIKLGETHGSMARLVGTSLRTYDRWEAGDAIPRGDMLVKFLALCPDEETRSLFDDAGSSGSKVSGQHPVSPRLRRCGPGDRLRMGFRNSCLASIEIIYESAVLGSQAAEEKLRNYVTELNREAVILVEGLLESSHPPT
jgi:DNA-binding XRE family transcriptional regulator